MNTRFYLFNAAVFSDEMKPVCCDPPPASLLCLSVSLSNTHIHTVKMSAWIKVVPAVAVLRRAG